MSSFDDFILSLDNDEISDFLAQVQPPELVESDSASIGKLIETIYYQAVNVSSQLMLFFLKKYHEWSQQ